MKLTQRNFLFWRTQLLHFLRSHDLVGFIDGSHPCPAAMIASSVGESSSGTTTVEPTPNPHKAWVQQDQSILSLLISSMSDEVFHLAVGRNTAAEVWKSISTALGSNTQARCLNLLGQFQALRQGNASPADYHGRAEILVEALAQAGSPLSLAEQNLYVLRGLRSEYRSYVASLTANAPVGLPTLSDYLQAADFILGEDFAPPADAGSGSNHTAMYAGRGRDNGNSHADGGRRGRNGGRNNNRGGRNGGQGSPRCQICRSHGH
ncbi:PREDICTED: uncharacterized protein LOC109170989 [Ipomoea nil]|uniref:uncharacterized protein LOC109170989 n=1 Tax=Ipomoea nil TaxID=35883 RepID=UPI000900E06D|nr:PREDICTED: uncharacterized protein LOC109170989 [Ipomoea nil]